MKENDRRSKKKKTPKFEVKIRRKSIRTLVNGL